MIRPHVRRPRLAQPGPEPGRAPPERALPRAGRRWLRQDARHRAQDRQAAADGAGAQADCGHHLYEQGRRRDARARQGPGGSACGARSGGQHLPLAGRAHAARRRHAPEPEGKLLHPRQRRCAGRAARCRRHHRRQDRPRLAVGHQPVEEPGPERRAGRGSGQGRPGTHGGQGDAALRGAPERLPGGGLRRPDRPAAQAVDYRPRGAAEVAGQFPSPAGRRVSGHQRRAVRAAQSPGGRAHAVHGRGRRRPEHLRLARRHHRQPQAPAAGLSPPEGHPAGAELPLHRRHPARGQPRDREEPQDLREEAVERVWRGRPGAGGGVRRRGARGRACRGPHQRAARARWAGQAQRFRHPLPRQPPGAGVRAEAARGADSLQGLGRAKLFRPRGDQGPVRLAAPAGQPGRRSRLPARRHHAQARRGPHDPGLPGRVCRQVEDQPVRGPVLAQPQHHAQGQGGGSAAGLRPRGQ